MKKFIYVFLVLLNFFCVSNVYAVDSYTPSQDLGMGTNTGTTTSTNGNQIAQSVGEVTQKGIDALDNVTSTLLNDIDNNIKQKVQNYYQQITSAITPIFGAFIVFWLIFNGIKMGLGNGDFQQIIFTFSILIIVFTSVFSWDFFYPYVVELFLVDLNELITEFTGTDAKSAFMSFVQIAFGAVADAMQGIDTGITNAVSGFFFVLIYSLIFGLVCIACAIFFLIIIISKVTLGILLAVAPIFLACAMFPATHSYARNWLQACLTPIVMNLLLIITCDLVMDSATKACRSMMESGSTFIGAWVLAIMTMIVIILFLIIPKIAMSLVGSGFEASSGASMSVTQKALKMMKGK